MGREKPGFLENMWVTTEVFSEKNPVSLVGCVNPAEDITEGTYQVVIIMNPQLTKVWV
jgi:hypothetical protein